MKPINRFKPSCRDPQRMADIKAHPVLNGIDFVEYEHRPLSIRPHVLVVTFLKDLPDPPHSDPDGAYGLTTHPEQIHIDGGTRIVDIRVRGAQPAANRLEIEVDQAGDFSEYQLSLGWRLETDGTWIQAISALDPLFSRTVFSFKADCPSEFDCRQEQFCPPHEGDVPQLDYLAKDYASFRQLLLDLIAQRNPDWLERNPADLGIALVELLSYIGDHLSYFQDAISNEAFLETVRQRISAKRHARLIDYDMHDGRNAWTYVHVNVSSTGQIPMGTKILSRVGEPMMRETALPGTVIREINLSSDAFDSDPALKKSRVFETAFPLDVYPQNNTIHLHTFGNLQCCLPGGATSVHVYATDPGNRDRVIRPHLAAGDFLVFEEVLGPESRSQADADTEHRQAVRLIDVKEDQDPLYSEMLSGGELQVRSAADTAMPLLKVTWSGEDALGFPLCISTETREGELLRDVSVARGNIVLADHGRTVVETHKPPEPVPADVPFRLRLSQGPVTLQCQPDTMVYELDPSEGASPVTERTNLVCKPAEAQPAVVLMVHFPTGDQLWTQVPHLLDSPPFATHFVVDIDNDGDGELRFGDGQYGREVAGATEFLATYRIGSGRSGNVGADALAHVVQPPVAPIWPAITAIRNLLAATDGENMETIEEVRQKAPAAFRAEQFRAVTEDDYKAAALEMDNVAGAVAAFRWTGSWYTVVMAVDPLNPEDLITESGSRTRLEPAFRDRVKAHINRYRVAGYDLEIRSGEYVPIEIDMLVCVKPDHFKGDVLEAVSWVLSNRINPDGTKGFFHPDYFTFAQPVYLSRLYAAVEAVDGVESATVTSFRVYDQEDNGELKAGIIPIGPWQIARLDNDPNFQENGVLRLSAGAGK
ncbi:MAG: putative baseplate assembly protein [Desulfobacterales bacterium]|jgi:hypothetical protein